MAYTKTTWVDRVVQYPNRYTKIGENSTEVTLIKSPGVVTQEGTLINAARMNAFEDAIYNADISSTNALSTANVSLNNSNLAVNNLYSVQREISSIKAASTVANRIDGASKIYYDIMNGTNNGSVAILDNTKTTLSSALSIGNTTLNVVSSSGFFVGEEITIQDDVNKETKVIVSIPNGTSITVSALTKAFKIYANVYRSLGKVNTTNGTLEFSDGYTVTNNNVRNDVSVTTGQYNYNYNLDSNRIACILSNNWIIVLRYDNPSKTYFLYKSVDGGGTFSQLCYVYHANYTSAKASLVAIQNRIHLVINDYNESGSFGISYFNIDATTATNTNIQSTRTFIDSGTLTSSGGINITTNFDKNEIHVAYSNKSTTYANSSNIRYIKGTVASNGTVSWSSITQVSSRNTTGVDLLHPSIVLDKNNNPFIFSNYTTAGGNAIYLYKFNGSTFSENVFYANSGYSQDPTSCIFIPQSKNGLANGRMWVTWSGYNSIPRNSLRSAYSDDNGTTWTTITIAEGSSSGPFEAFYPSITINSSGNPVIVYVERSGANSYYLKSIVYTTSWGGGITLKTLTTNSGGYGLNSCIVDFNLNNSQPLFVYGDIPNNKIGFYGTFTTYTSTPLLSEDIRYNIVPPSNIGNNVTWVDYDTLVGFSVDATVSFGSTESYVSTTKTSVPLSPTKTESQYVVTNQTPQSKGTLKITMARTSNSIAGTITSVTGGVS